MLRRTEHFLFRQCSRDCHRSGKETSPDPIMTSREVVAVAKETVASSSDAPSTASAMQPKPFLSKLFKMVDEEDTNHVVSWTPAGQWRAVLRRGIRCHMASAWTIPVPQSMRELTRAPNMQGNMQTCNHNHKHRNTRVQTQRRDAAHTQVPQMQVECVHAHIL